MEYIFLLAGLSLCCTVIIIKSANRTFKPRIAAREASYDPSLVMVPVDMIARVSTSVDKCTSLCTRDVEEDEVCAICLDHLNSSLSSNSEDREVREMIHNCDHLFHRGCLDAWVARGHVTCPICRAKLMAVAVAEEEAKIFRPAISRDPRRLERMTYLVGGDMMF